MDDLLFRDLLDLLAYWTDFPPAHVAIAGLLRSFADTQTVGAAHTRTAPAPPTMTDVRSFVQQFARGDASIP